LGSVEVEAVVVGKVIAPWALGVVVEWEVVIRC
jgi:hypothetical protein